MKMFNSKSKPKTAWSNMVVSWNNFGFKIMFFFSKVLFVTKHAEMTNGTISERFKGFSKKEYEFQVWTNVEPNSSHTILIIYSASDLFELSTGFRHMSTNTWCLASRTSHLLGILSKPQMSRTSQTVFGRLLGWWKNLCKFSSYADVEIRSTSAEGSS